MANAVPAKKGLTTFGWLALGAAGVALFSNKERRDNMLKSARDFAGKFTPGASDNTGTAPGATA